MKVKGLLVASIMLNAALGAVLLWPKGTPQPHSFENAVEGFKQYSPEAPLPRAQVVTVTAPTDPFHWRQLESSDFRQYMANLRAIGCPEETIRDLVIAEINKLYAPKFAALMTQAQHFEYWKPWSKKSREALAGQLEALRAEKRQLLQALIGFNPDPAERWTNITVDELVEQGRFAFLSADKQRLVREIMERHAASNEPDSRIMREKRRQDLAQVLSPDELYQFELRDSNAADSVRNRFGQADLTEAEYKKLFDLRKAYENEVGAVADYSDPEKAQKRSDARKVLEQAYKDSLGEARLREIMRQQDPGWRSLTQVGQQFNIDQQTLDRAYDFQQVAGEHMSKLLSDANLSRDERRKAMDTINAELQRNIAGVLGENAYEAFRKTSPEAMTFIGGDTFRLPSVPIGNLSAPPGAAVIISREVR